MDKENVVYLHNGALFGYKEEQNYVIWRKIELEIIMISEIKQTQKDKFFIFSLISRM
jgi:hypothetical protein